MSNFAHKGIANDFVYTMWLNENFTGTISEVSEYYWQDDSVQWKYRRGKLYFKFINTYEIKEPLHKGNILPSVCLYSKRGIYVPGDTSYFFLHKVPFRTQSWKSYVKNLQKTGDEAKIVDRYFGDSTQIQRKLSKAKPLNEVFEKDDKIKYFWFYKFWENVNTELYIRFKAPNHPH